MNRGKNWGKGAGQAKRRRGNEGHEWAGLHVYLKLWVTGGVGSELLVMVLLLLVRHTPSFLEWKPSHTHTQTGRCNNHTREHTDGAATLAEEGEVGGVSSNTGGTGVGGGLEERRRWGGHGLIYLLTDAFSQGLLKVSEEEIHVQSASCVQIRGNVGGT